MTTEAGIVPKRRRTAAEIEQVVREFEDSGLNRSQFCRREGLALITLNRYLKRVRGEQVSSGGLVAVEIGGGTHEGGGLAVVLSGGRRIEVGAGFDASLLRRLVQALETM